jgi:hypothetical protein
MFAACQGAVGPKGPKGDTGETGETGETGNTGIQGAPGVSVLRPVSDPPTVYVNNDANGKPGGPMQVDLAAYFAGGVAPYTYKVKSTAITPTGGGAIAIKLPKSPGSDGILTVELLDPVVADFTNQTFEVTITDTEKELTDVTVTVRRNQAPSTASAFTAAHSYSLGDSSFKVTDDDGAYLTNFVHEFAIGGADEGWMCSLFNQCVYTVQADDFQDTDGDTFSVVSAVSDSSKVAVSVNDEGKLVVTANGNTWDKDKPAANQGDPKGGHRPVTIRATIKDSGGLELKNVALLSLTVGVAPTTLTNPIFPSTLTVESGKVSTFVVQDLDNFFSDADAAATDRQYTVKSSDTKVANAALAEDSTSPLTTADDTRMLLTGDSFTVMGVEVGTATITIRRSDRVSGSDAFDLGQWVELTLAVTVTAAKPAE